MPLQPLFLLCDYTLSNLLNISNWQKKSDVELLTLKIHSTICSRGFAIRATI